MPDPKKGESRDDFMDRCMGDSKMNSEFGNPQQRAAVCNSYFEKKAKANVDKSLNSTDDNMGCDCGSSGESVEARMIRRDVFDNPGEAMNRAKEMGCDEIHQHDEDGRTVFMPCKTHEEYMSKNQGRDVEVEGYHDDDEEHKKKKYASEDCGCGCKGAVIAYEEWDEEDVTAAEYQGRKVTLNKPFRTPGANKKFGVYTMGPNGNVVIVRFGDPNMEIKRDDPKRRKAFRDRHNCDNPGPKYKARYWSCRQWRGGSKVEAELSMCAQCGDKEYCMQAGHCMESMTASDPDTPAPPKDRRKGSKKNKPGSATPGGKVTFSESVTNSLKNKVKEHNEKHDRKVTLGMLKAVYRRGAGAYSTSHRPGVSRAAWSMARVNAFLKLVRSGKPSNPKYTQDNDLLPKGHPRKSKKASIDSCGCGCEDDYEILEAEDDGICPIGEEWINGSCQPVSVNLELSVESTQSIVEASTGKTMIEITGIAFHEGMNRNKWEVTRQAVEMILPQMIGADVTLNHPSPDDFGFSRNMAGDVNEAVVGVITAAEIQDLGNGKWNVRYTARVYRPELFEALESGLWLRDGYGVSIGGTGVPTVADENGMLFDHDFKFDHLAIVHRPAYERANIETAEKVAATQSDFDKSEQTLISHSHSSSVQQSEAIVMAEEQKNMDEQQELLSEIESLKAEMVLKNAEIDSFKASEEARMEASRQEVVQRATEIGLRGHEDLSTEVVENLIASWEEANPAPEPVDMAPVVASTESPSEPVVASEPQSEAVVANYLNGKMVETPESLYSKAYNAWAKAWNQTLTIDERNDVKMRAKTYNELKEMN